MSKSPWRETNYARTGVTPPCGPTCSKRVFGCHSKCNDYLEYKKATKSAYDVIKERRGKEQDAFSSIVRCKEIQLNKGKSKKIKL